MAKRKTSNKRNNTNGYSTIKIDPKTNNQDIYLKSLEENKITFCEGPPGTGKAQPLDSIVYCENGPKLMGDLKLNDIVLTPDGSRSKIINIYPQGIRDVYKINFKDGSYVESCLEHLWKVYDSISRISKIIDTQTILTTYLSKNNRSRYHIILPTYADFKEQTTTIDAYLLGILIGDGGLTQNITISSADPSIIEAIKKVLPNGHGIKKLKHGKYDYIISSKRGQPNVIKNYIRNYNLNVKSQYKFIPNNYKYNTTDIRISILQGLLDTDGSISVSYKNGKAVSSHIEYSTTSLQLANDVKEIVESLGGICKINSRYTNYTYKNNKKTGLKSYRCYIKLEYFEPFRLHRKLNKVIKKTKYIPKRIINNVEFSRKTYTQCIKIEHSDHMYLTNNFVPTHNTYLATLKAIEGLLNEEYYKIIISRPLVQSGEDSGYLPGNINDKLDPYVRPIYDILEHSFPHADLDRLKDERKIEVIPFGYMRGRNFFNSFIILDEVQNCSYEQLLLALTRFAKNSKMAITGDARQSDLPHIKKGGFETMMKKLVNVEDIGIVKMKVEDIIREPIIKTILEKLDVKDQI